MKFMLFKLLSLDYGIPQPCFPHNTHNTVTTISEVPETGNSSQLPKLLQ